MIWLLKPDHPKTMELAPAMTEGTGILPGLRAVAGKPVRRTSEVAIAEKPETGQAIPAMPEMGM